MQMRVSGLRGVAGRPLLSEVFSPHSFGMLRCSVTAAVRRLAFAAVFQQM